MSHSSHAGSKVGARISARPSKSSRKAKRSAASQPIVIDEQKGLVFESEKDLYRHFEPQIAMLEDEVLGYRTKDDIPISDFKNYEGLLQQVLDDPDEVWQDVTTIHGARVTSYVGHFQLDKKAKSQPGDIYYVALAYAVDGGAKFIYLHFPSSDLKLVDRFRRGELMYDRIMKEVEKGAVEGDALSEGDPLAVGLYKAMIAVRAATDIEEEKFREFEDSREETIEEPDEIWRSVDSGQCLVTFIKEFESDASMAGQDYWYVAVTVEDEASSSHALLFSFPTNDVSLIERYRHGENLQAEEVTQEASH